jgi:hypothetical protein
MTEPVTNQQDAAAEGAPGLTINDLTLALQVIQISTQRGTFKPEELSTVGALYDRIIKFLDSTGALKKADPAPEAANSTPAATVEEGVKPAKKPAVKKAATKSKGTK